MLVSLFRPKGEVVYVADRRAVVAGMHAPRGQSYITFFDGQFRYLNEQAGEYVAAGQPVISVDTKKKELIGSYANGGREWQPAGQPTRVNVHDFADRALGEFAKAIPYGIYDTVNDEGWVSVGDSADTAEFAVVYGCGGTDSAMTGLTWPTTIRTRGICRV